MVETIAGGPERMKQRECRFYWRERCASAGNSRSADAGYQGNTLRCGAYGVPNGIF